MEYALRLLNNVFLVISATFEFVRGAGDKLSVGGAFVIKTMQLLFSMRIQFVSEKNVL